MYVNYVSDYILPPWCGSTLWTNHPPLVTLCSMPCVFSDHNMTSYNDVINDVIARENLNGGPDGHDHADGVVGSGDAVRGQIGKVPTRWWS